MVTRRIGEHALLIVVYRSALPVNRFIVYCNVRRRLQRSHPSRLGRLQSKPNNEIKGRHSYRIQDKKRPRTIESHDVHRTGSSRSVVLYIIIFDWKIWRKPEQIHGGEINKDPEYERGSFDNLTGNFPSYKAQQKRRLAQKQSDEDHRHHFSQLLYSSSPGYIW